MTDTFKIELELTYPEFLAASLYIVSKMKMAKKIFLITCGIGVFNGIMSLTAPGKSSAEWQTTFFQFLFLPFFILIFFFVFVSIGAGIWMLLKPNQFKNISYQFTHWGMEKTTTDMNFSRQWSKFQKFKETKHFILLYVSENDAHIIQKRKFHSKEEVADFIGLITKNIGAHNFI